MTKGLFFFHSLRLIGAYLLLIGMIAWLSALVNLIGCSNNDVETSVEALSSAPGLGVELKRDVIMWTKPEPNIDFIATKYRMFIGPLNNDIANIILRSNPDAILFQYANVRYFYPYLETLWYEYCSSRNIDPEQGYLHSAGGYKIIAPETMSFKRKDGGMGWQLANINNTHFSQFILYWMVSIGNYPWLDGMMMDVPIRVVAWKNYGPPVEVTEKVYDDTCIALLTQIKQVIGKPLIVNVSNLWWYERSPDPFRSLTRRAVEVTDGPVFESGGAWTFGELKSKWIIMTKQPNNVYVGK